MEPSSFLDDARGCQSPFVLCLHPQGFLQRGVLASGSFQERTVKSGSFSMWHHPRGYEETENSLTGAVLKGVKNMERGSHSLFFQQQFFKKQPTFQVTLSGHGGSEFTL